MFSLRTTLLEARQAVPDSIICNNCEVRFSIVLTKLRHFFTEKGGLIQVGHFTLLALYNVADSCPVPFEMSGLCLFLYSWRDCPSYDKPPRCLLRGLKRYEVPVKLETEQTAHGTINTNTNTSRTIKQE